METVVVTRHPALVEYLKEIGLITGDEPVISHATADQIRGKRVIGVLPMHLAAEAAEIVEVPLTVPPELRGQELDIEQVRQFAGEPRVYRVSMIPMTVQAAIKILQELPYFTLLNDPEAAWNVFAVEAMDAVPGFKDMSLKEQRKIFDQALGHVISGNAHTELKKK